MQQQTEKKVMLSGIKPSGDLTLGSYLGAIKNWAARAEEYDCYYFMADLHSITVRQNPADLRRRTLEQLAQYIACGLDPDFYNYRAIGLDEITPWSHLDVGVSHAHLVREYQKALKAETTQPCNRQCSGCGANKLLGGPCFDYSKNLL